MKKHIVGYLFGATAVGLSLAAPVIYAMANYSNILESTAGKLTAAVGVSLLLGFRYIFFRLKMVAEDGFGMNKEAAREVRFILPLFLILAVVVVIETNLAGITDVIRFTLITNLIASPFRLTSYRLSKKYENDTALQKMYHKF